MRFQVLACDYDGTLATHGAVDAHTIASLKALKRSGRKLFMVTGRRLNELLTVFPHAALFDRIVAENGALLYRPATNGEVVLAEPPPAAFVSALELRGVAPLDVGRVIVATWEPHETVVLEVIRDLGLGMQIILNKGAVMVLPTDVSKATGLRAALAEMGFSPHNAAAIGDAENDHALLAAAECGAAVANSVDALKGRADVVTVGDHGAGVAEFIEQILHDDLASWIPALARHDVPLGVDDEQRPFLAPTVGGSYRVIGKSSDGLLAWVRAFVAQMSTAGYQWALVVDCDTKLPQQSGAFPSNAVHAKSLEEVEQTLADPQRSAIIHCADLTDAAGPAFARALDAQFRQLWGSAGRPHWVIWMDAPTLLRGVEAEAIDTPTSYGVVHAHAQGRESARWFVDLESATFVEQGAESHSLGLLAASTIGFETKADSLRFKGNLDSIRNTAQAGASP